MKLGRLGVWSASFRGRATSEAAEAIVELEELGYTALWLPDGAGGPIFETTGFALDASRELVVATGIVNVWMHEAAESAAAYATFSRQHPGRFVLGLGISHSALFADPTRYGAPVETMAGYLDVLDAASPPVPEGERILAALNPRMLRLAGERTLGTHPYFVPPEHTALARETVGPEAVVAPEQAVVLFGHPEAAREIGRAHVSRYLDLPNFTRPLERLGFREEDFADGGSDRLVDAIVAWGDEDAIAARVDEHLRAGADHVCLQVLGTGERLPLDEWRRLAAI